MNFINRTVTALCVTLVRQHGNLEALTDGRLGGAVRFIDWQLTQMPDYLHLPFKILTCLFGVWICFFYFRPFHKLDYVTRSRILAVWRNSRIGVRRDFIRFYETLVAYDLAFNEVRLG